MELNTIYSWEMETIDNIILNQYNEDGTENSWKKLNADEIVRISLIPCINLLPRHDVFIDLNNDEKFVKRFARGFKKARDGFALSEYVNCIVTNKYRLWVLSSGRCILTHKDYELYI
jgi:hypothetical protein